jgi:16S rRNA (adenine1518-N6/adenine1519-N6)-dimethyltransferase
LKTKKQFGQHWLRNERVLDRIMTAAAVSATDRVLEIGPGMGVLTTRLAKVAPVVAVEIDRDLCAYLVKKMGDHDNFLLLQGDFLDLTVDEPLLPFPRFQQPNKVVANIPYNITGPILEKLLGSIAAPLNPAFESITLLVQKEVAARLTAKPGTKAFGAFTVRIQYLADCQMVCPVPAKDFSPPPKVDSAVIQLRPRPFPVTAQDTYWLDTLVRMGFSSRRKMLRNNLQSAVAGEPTSNRDLIGQLLIDIGLTADARAENLSVGQWIELSHLLHRSDQHCGTTSANLEPDSAIDPCV